MNLGRLSTISVATLDRLPQPVVTGAKAIHIFLVWWMGELTQLAPRALRDWLAGHADRVSIDVRSDEICIVDSQSHPERSWRVPVSDAARLPKDADTLINRSGGAILLAPEETIIRRTVDLPQAAAAEINAAISFLVARLSPYPPSDIYFAARVLWVDRARKRARAEVLIASKASIDQKLAALDALSIPIARVGVAGNSSKPPLDLVRGRRAARGVRTLFGEAWKFVALAGLALFVAGPAIAAYWAGEDAATLAQKATRSAKRNEEALKLRSDVAAIAASHAAMAALERRPRALETLQALTQTLPDNTWVFALEIEPDVAVLKGFSPDVPDLLNRLSAPPFDSPELISPIAHGLEGGKDRFELRVKLRAASP